MADQTGNKAKNGPYDLLWLHTVSVLMKGKARLRNMSAP
jgi:hypothetical protein